MFELPSSLDQGLLHVAPALLAVARPLGLASVAPGWGGAALGFRTRLVVAAALALILQPIRPVGPEPPTASAGAWAGWMAWELALGVGLGLTAALVVAGARQAGELVGIQSGLAPASVLDPESPGPAPPDEPLNPLGQLYGLIATAVFLALDGPLRLVDALANSYRLAPPAWRQTASIGQPNADGLAQLVPDLFGRIGATLGLALQAAAPAGLGVLAASLALAVMARSATARPLTDLAWPARAVLGIGLTLVGLGLLGSTLATAWNRWAAEWTP
jgi:flagellar biosynthetic protein FliR